MPATRRRTTPVQPTTFKVFAPDPEAVLEPVSEPEKVPAQQRILNPLSSFGARIATQFSDVKVTAEDKARANTEMTATEFYRRFMESDRRRELDPKTVRLDYDALCWFSSVGIPEDWPVFHTWEGPPIGCVTASWIETLVEESLLDGLAANTIGKYLRHLRTMFNHATKLGLIPKLSIAIPSEEPEARPFTDGEVERIYRGLAECPAMQIAFVLALATGARFGDLFWAQWDQFDFERRQFSFQAEKTGKHQLVPLTNVPIKHLKRLPRFEAPFASLVDQALPPEFRSEHYQSRMINARWRCMTGFPAPPRLKKLRPANCVAHPWHSARSTAAVWIESVASGMGSKLLGHDAEKQGQKVTRRHYLTPLVSADLREAAERILWPPYFEKIHEPRQGRLF